MKKLRNQTTQDSCRAEYFNNITCFIANTIFLLGFGRIRNIFNFPIFVCNIFI